MSESGVQSGPTAAELVPAVLPADHPPPKPARTIGFARAVLLICLSPKRVGPHLASGSLRRAVAAYLVAAIVSAFALGLLVTFDISQSTRGQPTVRDALAAFVLMSAAGQYAAARLPVLLLVLVLAGIALLPPLTVVFSFVRFAGGDTAKSTLRRAALASLWSTCALLPGALVVATWAAVLGRGRARLVPDSNPIISRFDDAASSVLTETSTVLWIGVAGVISLILYVRAIVASTRYVGPAVGPGWEPREPRCEICGYSIVGLRRDGRCPECAGAVRESLPGTRRRETEWERDRRTSRGLLALLKAHIAVIRGAAFFRILRVRQDLTAAHHYRFATICLVTGIMLYSYSAAWYWVRDFQDRWQLEISLFVAVAPMFMLNCLLLWGACVWGRIRHGITDLRVPISVASYAGGWLWLIAPPLALAFMTTGWQAVAAGALTAFMFALAWRRICDGLSLTRHANS